MQALGALQNICYGLKCFLQQKRNIDIVKDSEFNKSNEIFRAVSTNLKRKRLGGLTTILPFQSRIFRNCTVNTPFGLQRKVWFEIMLYT